MPSPSMRLAVIILAAGQGKRMVSDIPKVLHRVGGKPLLDHVLATVGGLGIRHCFVVYGHGGEVLRAAFAERVDLIWIEQAEQLGTGHAVSQVLPSLSDEDVVIVLYGDVPLVRGETLKPLVESACQGRLSLLTVELRKPAGYGRIIRDATGQVVRIVEENDATAEERCISEVNTGILAVPVARLKNWIQALDNDNAQGEYYLTDVITMAVQENTRIDAFKVADPEEVQGVNDRLQLAELERFYQRRLAESLLRDGVTLLDPSRVDIRGTLVTGKDVVIDVNVIFEGEVRLGNRISIGPHSLIRNTVIGDDSQVLSHCFIEEAQIGRGVQIGPFARLRPGNHLEDGVRVGNFVEIKKSLISRGSKVNHLSYVGDTEIGADVNVGAGTITCNYDGAHKHKTVIEDKVFIGSNTALVAPVRVGKGATVGAGSTITRDVPADSLSLTRAPQKTISGWRRPRKT
jgi:bifunctional UDP-N-acetylglucosamine pyrophosphorylase/glucosamine-1-phosphate N-acetyltransferase